MKNKWVKATRDALEPLVNEVLATEAMAKTFRYKYGHTDRRPPNIERLAERVDRIRDLADATAETLDELYAGE